MFSPLKFENLRFTFQYVEQLVKILLQPDSVIYLRLLAFSFPGFELDLHTRKKELFGKLKLVKNCLGIN